MCCRNQFTRGISSESRTISIPTEDSIRPPLFFSASLSLLSEGSKGYADGALVSGESFILRESCNVCCVAKLVELAMQLHFRDGSCIVGASSVLVLAFPILYRRPGLRKSFCFEAVLASSRLYSILRVSCRSVLIVFRTAKTVHGQTTPPQSSPSFCTLSWQQRFPFFLQSYSSNKLRTLIF